MMISQAGGHVALMHQQVVVRLRHGRAFKESQPRQIQIKSAIKKNQRHQQIQLMFIGGREDTGFG